MSGGNLTPKVISVSKGKLPLVVVELPAVAKLQPDGTQRVTRGKLVEWLAPKHFCAIIGCDRDTVYRWMQAGIIPSKCVKPAGVRKHEIHASAVQHVMTYFAEVRASKKRRVNTNLTGD